MTDYSQHYADMRELNGTPASIETPAKRIERFSFARLSEKYPNLRPPVIDGLIREAETANVISVSKIGKSWLVYNLALCIITGRPWLEGFATATGRVLLIDNELHRETLAHRVKTVAEAMELKPPEYAEALEVWPLRGDMRNINTIGEEIADIKPGTIKVIIIDAKYRMLPPETSENDNAAETAFFNQLDAYAAQTGAAILCVHHSSKGNQGEKRVTDVGAGAGAQSRAADCHVILREHEEETVVVLEAAVRSFAPVDPLVVRWAFPLWIPVDGIDPSKLKGRLTTGERRQNVRDKEGIAKIAERLKRGPATTRQLRDTGLSKERLERLLGVMESDCLVKWKPKKIKGTNTREYRLAGQKKEAGGDDRPHDRPHGNRGRGGRSKEDRPPTHSLGNLLATETEDDRPHGEPDSDGPYRDRI